MRLCTATDVCCGKTHGSLLIRRPSESFSVCLLSVLLRWFRLSSLALSPTRDSLLAELGRSPRDLLSSSRSLDLVRCRSPLRVDASALRRLLRDLRRSVLIAPCGRTGCSSPAVALSEWRRLWAFSSVLPRCRSVPSPARPLLLWCCRLLLSLCSSLCRERDRRLLLNACLWGLSSSLYSFRSLCIRSFPPDLIFDDRSSEEQRFIVSPSRSSPSPRRLLLGSVLR